MRAEESRAMAENWFARGGELGALLRSHDWSQTPLGAIETWSDDLKRTVQILITELDQANQTEKPPLNVDLRQNGSAAALDQGHQLNAFRVKLVDALRPLTDASEIQAIAARILGEALGATRVTYIEVVSSGEEVIVHHSYTNGVAELSGRYRLEDYRRNLPQDHQAGRTQIVTDIPNDPRYADAEKARYREIDIAAHIDVPLIKNNQFVALLAAQQSSPRQWTETEVKLVEETAERTWASVERARAEAALRESEAKYRTLFESIDQGFCVIEVLFDENSKPFDYRFLEINPAFEKQTGLTDVQGKRMRELAPHHEAYWFEIYGNIALTGEPSRFENCAAALNRWYDVYAFRIGHPDERKIAVLFNDITDRLRIEDERRHVEQERDRFLAVGSDLQVITGSNGYFHWVSPTFERLLGWTTAEMISRPWTGFVHPDDISASELEVTSLFSGNETFEFENRYRHKDGSYRWLLWNAKLYPAEQIIYAAAVDITERKQTEVALRESEERFRTLTATIPQLIWTATPDGSVDYLSQQWADYIGLPPEQLYEWHWQDVVHPQDLPNTLSDWSYSLQTGKPLEIKHRFRFRTGEWRWQLVRGTPIKDETGQVTKWVGTCTDIQSEMDAQAMLHQSEARLRTVAANLPNGAVFILDRELRYQLAEGKALEEAGFTSQDLVGKTIWQAIDPSLAEIYASYFRQALNGEPFSWEHSSYNRYYISHGTPLYSDRGEVEAVLAVSYDITDRKRVEDERKQAEAELQEAHIQLESALVAGAVYTWRWNIPADRVVVNAAFAHLFGVDPVEATTEGLPVEFFICSMHEDDRAHVSAAIQQAVTTGEEYMAEYRVYSATGEVRWVTARGRVEYDAAGNPLAFPGALADVTDRKLAEAALRQSEQRFRLMADAVPQIVWITDAEGRVEFFNKQWCNYTGVPYEPTTAAEVTANFIHPEDSDRTMAVFNEARCSGDIFSVEHRIRSAAGTYRWFLVRAEPYRDPQTGEIVRWFGVSVDIHDRKQAEEAIRQSEARYRLLAEAIPQFVWMTDAAGQNEYVNQRFCDYTGLTAEQMHGSNWLSIMHPDDLEITRDRWLTAVNSGQFYEIEYRFRRFDGSYRWFLGQGIPLKDEQGQIYKWFGTCTDIEPQKQIEQARLQLLEQEQNAREQAETANRIKDEFLAVLSHELRSPLNPILGWTRLLQSGNLDAARQREALATIERNAKLQTQLIEDLLDISRIMRGKLSLTVAPVSLAFVISAAVETVRLAAEAKNIQIILDLASVVAPVSGDAARLQQVVWNLLTNAVKFTPNTGQVTVELRQLNGLAQIRVIDTGKGINPQFLPHVFEYFRQEDGSTTRKFGGLGLGLAIARQIVELHGGSVWAESQGEGRGATFVVELPLPQRTANQGLKPEDLALSPQPSTLSSSLAGLHILLVDDEPDTREFQAFLLEQNGARVTAVASALEALQVLERAIPDVLVSDIAMAEMDGYMLLQQIRSRPSEQGGMIPAIALTAYATEIDQQRALQAGFQTHLTKPIELEDLVRAIATLLELT